MLNFLTKIFGSRNERLLKRMAKTVQQINELEPKLSVLTDMALQDKTQEFRKRLAQGQTLESLLPETFAVVREVAKRVLNMRHFDVQLVGGIVLHEGKIAEMRTGEGKTLVATLPAYLNALTGEGVHIVTVNDYLAKRDAAWMGRIYTFLGMTVDVIVAGMLPDEKRKAYQADIVYGTNNEFGFDYLRDNMAFEVSERVMRQLHYAIVDEVDSILIDEARTPLIISGPTDDTSELYNHINKLFDPKPVLKPQARETQKDEEIEVPGDYYVDEKSRQVFLSEEGHQHVEEFLRAEKLLSEEDSLYDTANVSLMHHVQAVLRAHTLFHRNVDYIIKPNNEGKLEVVIVDEFTGRTMPGRRWSDGLHQAVEAKEHVEVQNENQTLASITFQNLFRLYKKLAGMTGTADTEAYEFQQIYGLEVVVIPTHKLMIRKDEGDLVYLGKQEKFKAIIESIKDCRHRGQPVLVGTVSIESSEELAKLLEKENIKDHQVLNAKFHEQEAHIVAQAGRPGAITIATNMAGRGTDIVLGGNVEAEINALAADTSNRETLVQQMRTEWQKRHELVVRSGGLHIIGTERHESRRIDNQLRGRSGRQGDPGSSRFYLSLEDNLMRIFASDNVANIMKRLGMAENEAIEHRWVTKAIENAQRKVEGRNFDIRKQLLEYDDVANDQRKVVYAERNELMESDSILDRVQTIQSEVLTLLINQFVPPQSLDEMWNIAGLEEAIEKTFALRLPIQQWLDTNHDLHEITLRERIAEAVNAIYTDKEKRYGAEWLRRVEKFYMLHILDKHWKEHLAAMDYLRQGIHLRGYAQKNPKQEYKREAFEMFKRMVAEFKQEVIGTLHKFQVQAPESVAIEEQRQPPKELHYQHGSVDVMADEAEATAPAEPVHQQPFVRQHPKVGRNETCPCGSGKKYKNCHGKLQ